MFNVCGAVDRGGGGHPKPRPTVKDGSVLTSRQYGKRHQAGSSPGKVQCCAVQRGVRAHLVVGSLDSFEGWVRFHQGKDVCEVRVGEIPTECFSMRKKIVGGLFIYFTTCLLMVICKKEKGETYGNYI